jgi:hypothetical protein
MFRRLEPERDKSPFEFALVICESHGDGVHERQSQYIFRVRCAV